MVYVLRDNITGETVVLGENNSYTLGRSRINSILLRDRTCSCKHAQIHIKHGYATILDINSKRGTFVNKQKIYDETRLKDGDVIRFGLNNCKYSFIDPKFQTFLDKSVPKNTKNALKDAFKTLNVTLTENYSIECTHYTTELVNLDMLKTSRLLDALIDQKPIVTAKFWISMFKNIEQAIPIPNIYRYMPEIDDELKHKGVERIIPKKKQTVLFKDKLFIFFDVALEKRMEHLIWKCGGGTVQHNNKGNFASSLVKQKDFNEAIVVKQVSQEEPSLTVTYFIDKLTQYDKTVREVIEDDVYIIILKGHYSNIVDDQRREDTAERPVESGMSIDITDDSDHHEDLSDSDQPQTSKSLEKEQSVKKKPAKRNWTTLSRWIQPARKNKSTKKQDETDAGNKAEELDTSLDMGSSSEDSDTQERELHKEKKSKVVVKDSSSEETMEFSTNSKIEGKSIINKKSLNRKSSSKKDSSTESPDNFRRKTKISRSNKKINKSDNRQNLATIIENRLRDSDDEDSTEMNVVKHTSNKELSSELKKRLNPASLRETDEEDSIEMNVAKHTSSEQKGRLSPLTIHDNMLEPFESFNIRRKNKRSKECFSIPDDTDESAKRVCSSTEDKWDTSKSRPGMQKKSLKVNPLARLKNSPKGTTNAINDVLLNKNLENTKSNAFKCFLHCLLTKYGWMDEDGGFLLHDIRETLQQSDVEIPSLEYILYVCTAMKSMNRCQRAYLFTECFWNKMEEQQPSEDELFYDVEQKK